MLRSLTAIGITLALVGTAHAQEHTIAVSLHGKSHAAVRSEIYKAAEKVCASSSMAFDPTDYVCIEATYEDAMRQLRVASGVERIAYAVPGSAH